MADMVLPELDGISARPFSARFKRRRRRKPLSRRRR